MSSLLSSVGLLLVLTSAVVVQSLVQPVTPHDLEERDRELTNLLQARLQNYRSEESVGNVRFTLGKGKTADQDTAPVSTTPQDLNIPVNPDAISQDFWSQAQKELKKSGASTPQPSAADVNKPLATPTPKPWQVVMQESAQPLNTKFGGAVMYGISGGVTPTPPPTQAAVGQQFVAQCPMVLFDKNLSIRAATCNDTLGSWVDPSPLNPRAVLRWQPLAPAGIRFGVDSALTGPGSALFAEITEEMTLYGYHFVMKNCLGIERWHIEENVYKVDDMGKVSSTIELHDITMNSEAFFLKYLIKSPTGITVAESNLFRMLTNQVNFTKYVNGINTGEVLAVATRQGRWTKKGWEACMSASSPRGWSLYFPQSSKKYETVATVQDIRVALTGAMTLMAYRNENRGANGLNNQGSQAELYAFLGACSLIIIGCILTVNFVMVFRNSGIKDKIKKTLLDTQGLLPKRPSQGREAPLHPCY